MSDDIASLGLDIDTRKLKQGERDLDAFQRKTKQIEDSASRMESQWKRAAMAAGGLAASIGLAFSVAKVIEYGDAWKQATNQLRLATDGVQQLRAAQQGVFDISQKTFTSLAATAQLTSKINQYAGNLTGGLEGTLQIVETINKAVAIGGTAAASQAAGLFQLNQALASGVLRGEELNSVMEQTPVVARAIAEGLGLTIGELRKVAAQGKITSEVVIDAFKNQAEAIDEAFKQIEPTVGMSLSKLQSSITRLVGEGGSEAFNALAMGISSLADALGSDAALDDVTASIQNLIKAATFAAQVLPAVAAGLASMFIVRQLTPLWVALDFAMQGAAGRALVVERATQVMAAGMTTARASATGLTTALGGPMALAIGVVSTALVFMATSARSSLQDTSDAVAETVNRVRAAAAQARDANAEVAAVGAKKQAEEIRSAERAFAEALEGVSNKRRALEAEKIKAADIALARSGGADVSFTADILGASSALQQAERDANNFKSALLAAYAEVRGAAQSAVAGVNGSERDRLGLLGGPDKEALKDAERAAKRLAEQTADYKLMFATLQSGAEATAAALQSDGTLDALDAQLDRLAETEDLLKKFPDYYAKAGDVALDLARADAAILQQKRNQIATDRELLRIRGEYQRLPQLASALSISVQEYDLLTKAWDIMKDAPNLTQAQAIEEAKKVEAVERTTAALEAQAERARELAEAPARNWLDGLISMSDDFWTDWVNKGFAAFDDLGDAFKDLWKRLFADLLRKEFQPFEDALRNAFSMASGGAGLNVTIQGPQGSAGTGAGLSTPFGAGGVSGATGGAGGGGFGGAGGFAGFNSMNFGNLGNLAALAIGSQGDPGLMGLGFLNGGGGLFANSLGGMNRGLMGLGGALDGIFNPANAMGGMIGSGAANLAGLTGKNAGIGGALGGIAGSFFGGPIGSAIGSFLGQAIGSMLGPQPSNQGAVARVDSSGRVTGVEGSKRTAETEGAAREAADAVADGQRLLKEMGATLGATIDALIIGVRDVSRFSVSGDAGEISIGTVGDSRDLAMRALQEVLKSAEFASPILNQVADGMTAAGRSFEDTLEVLGALSDLLPDTAEPLSQWGEELKHLNEVFDELREKTQGVADAALNAAEAQARGGLRDRFNESISDALLAATSPLQSQLRGLLEIQTQRAKDAAVIGGNMGDVFALNASEIEGFIKQAGASAEAFAALADEMARLRSETIAAGGDIGALDGAFAGVTAKLGADFDKAVSADIAKLANPTLAALTSVLDAQKARLTQAQQLGGNLTAVERLNALETQRFFEGLSDDQFRQLGDYLGIVEDFTGRIGSTLVSLRDEIDGQIDGFDDRRQDLQDQSDAFRSGADALLGLRSELLDRYSDLTPQASLDELRVRFGQLTTDARAGNASAITALPQVADQLISRSRDLFGSTKDFRNDLNGVTRVLEEIGGAASARADAVDGQLATLEQQRDTLIEIRDLLGQPDPGTAALEDALNTLGEGSGAIADLLREYLDLQQQRDEQQGTIEDITNAAIENATKHLPTPVGPPPAELYQAPPATHYAPQPVSGGQVIREASPPPAQQQGGGQPDGDGMVTDILSEVLNVLRQAGREAANGNRDTRLELRRLGELLLAG